MLNPGEELAALRVLVKDRTTMYQNIRTLLEAADAIYRAAQPFDEDVRAFEEIPESELDEFVEEEAERLLKTVTQMASAKWCMYILVDVYGSDALLEELEALLTDPMVPEPHGTQEENEVVATSPTECTKG